MRLRFSAQAFAVVIGGAIALILVTAILASAFTSAQVAGDLRHATTQLQQIRQADAAAEQARVERSAAVNQQLTMLRRQNAEQAERDRQQRRYLAQISKVLRSHGIPVPPPPKATVSSSPKAPRRSHNPANPEHTAHGPRNPSSTPSPTYCTLVPALCDGLPLGLPTSLP